MAAFIIRRLIWTIPVILLVILMTFVMMKQIGGNPFRRTERPVPPQVQENLERKFDLDEPWYVQYLTYVKNTFTFDFGPSLSAPGRDVNDYVTEQFPRSIKLGILAFIWAILLGLPAGIIAALRPNSFWDYGVMFFSNVGFAIPSFLVATLLIYYFAVKFGARAHERLAARGLGARLARAAAVVRPRAAPDGVLRAPRARAPCSRRSSRTTCARRVPRASATAGSSACTSCVTR